MNNVWIATAWSTGCGDSCLSRPDADACFACGETSSAVNLDQLCDECAVDWKYVSQQTHNLPTGTNGIPSEQ
jgi:hypothetical protein